MMTLTYEGGWKVVGISDNAPIVRVDVVVFPGKNDGPAPFIIVGEKGVVPPM